MTLNEIMMSLEIGLIYGRQYFWDSNGHIYVKFRVTNLLSGILVGFMLYSINLRVMGGIPNISLINSNTIFVYYPVVQLLIISLAVCGITTYLLITDFGLSLRSLVSTRVLLL